jgi:hypothetical protein
MGFPGKPAATTNGRGKIYQSIRLYLNTKAEFCQKVLTNYKRKGPAVWQGLIS